RSRSSSRNMAYLAQVDDDGHEIKRGDLAFDGPFERCTERGAQFGEGSIKCGCLPVFEQEGQVTDALVGIEFLTVIAELASVGLQRLEDLRACCPALLF